MGRRWSVCSPPAAGEKAPQPARSSSSSTQLELENALPVNVRLARNSLFLLLSSASPPHQSDRNPEALAAQGPNFTVPCRCPRTCVRPMAEQLPGEGSSSRNTVSGESSDTNLELNVKTLDSRIFHFQVDKSMRVSAFKEKIANDIGVSAGQQRLIFRGKVLKDDHLLSQYHVENGDTLHLVERQPTQPQPSSGSGSGETTSNFGTRVNDANPGAPRGRVGQISHSVVLGTFNVGEQGEGIVPDISRVIGTVLNSIGLGNLGQVNVGGNGQPPVMLNIPSQGPQGNVMEGSQGNVSGQTQAGSQPSSGLAIPNTSVQSLPQVVQIPLAAAAIPVPSLHAPIPDSLNTLLEFMNRMEQALSHNGNQQNPSSTRSVELPSSARGLPSPEALGIVLRHAERLLSGQAVAALSHIAGRLEQEGASSDPAIRSQIQAEASQTGIAMQHLGALFLELGRTILTLRVGQSPGESFVNAGPAVYISPSGPNPIMVQPFPLQSNSLFGGSVPPVNPVAFGPVGVGNPPRHVNIHIHAGGTSLAPIVSAAGGRLSTGDGAQGERGDSNSSRDSGTATPLRTVVAATVPARPSSVPSSTASQSIPVSGTQSHPEIADPLSSVVAQINSQIRSLVANVQEGNQAPSGQAATTIGSASAHEQPNVVAAGAGSGPTHSSSESTLDFADKPRAESSRAINLEDSRDHETSRDASGPSGDAVPSQKSEGASSSSGSHDAHEGTNSTPLGLGLGGLERKKRAKQPKPQPKGGDGEPTSTVPEKTNAQTNGQQLLQSLLSRGPTAERTSASTLGTGFPSPATGQSTNSNASTGGQVSNSQLDVSGMMSQVLQSPALNGLLSGVSEQTGVGSPDVLRNMLQQLTQSPVMMNTVSRIAQQVDSQDIGSMFAGMGGGQGGGGGVDLSRMVQQMMPMVSQAFGGGPPGSGSFPPAADHETERQPSDQWHDFEDRASDRMDRVQLDSVARQIESLNPPEDVFRAMVESAVQSSGTGSGSQDILDALCSDEELANEYADMLSRDLRRRLQGDYPTDN
ncbi:hypothetical protein CRG98_024454 [Punica granatum]|uniref:Ubiquitin-like domain-containing protein n=2 Tax=Punica granatum TaxID=22663 RepID=A0A2I0JGN9_PUNGR|nr:hypothetical protein CRG98_024454 [Punica granatum]